MPIYRLDRGMKLADYTASRTLDISSANPMPQASMVNHGVKPSGMRSS